MRPRSRALIATTVLGLLLIGGALIARSMMALPPPPAVQTPSAENVYPRPSDDELRRRLTPLQYAVVRENDTEKPWLNPYWNHKQPGIYVDIVSGEPLFASVHKYDSGTGWPSFWQPLEPERVIEVVDSSHGMTRTEVRSRDGDSHLGHVFDDGPAPTGKRYCINSASLAFIPADELERHGLERYDGLFAAVASR